MDHFSAEYLRNLRNLRGQPLSSGPPPRHLGALQNLNRFRVCDDIKFIKQDAMNDLF